MPQALYKKLKITKEDFKNTLKSLYFNDKKSQSQISKLLNCDVSCVENWFKRFKIVPRTYSESTKIRRQKNCNISPQEIDVLNGLLLSDLHIEDGTFQARLAFTLKHKEFADSIINSLPFVKWGNLRAYKSKRTPNLNYLSKSGFYVELFDLRNKWYKNRTKIVPSDIILTKETLYWWYLGDGYLETRRSGLLLCTEGFSTEINLMLVKKLEALGFNCFLTKRSRIRFRGREQMEKFLKYIGEPRLKCYEYKWKTS